jgi:DNA (cytosine-5)-methyltransferase 1
MNIIELFAGVGGFRVGLERVDAEFYNTIWSNQYEPSTKQQHASQTYIARFGTNGHINKDIAQVTTDSIPNHDMLCGGFPCQDYSVARTLSQAEGLKGKKGVLWWEIERICREKGENSAHILFLENVDRLTISPAKQRGRDFAIILQSLADLNYIVEWRIINAAEYGMPQRRRRIYILAYKHNTPIANSILDPIEWILNTGIFATAFPIQNIDINGERDIVPFNIKQDATDELADISDYFNANNKERPFSNAGIMINGQVWTCKVESNYEGPYTNLGDILATGIEREYITEDFYISEEDLEKWKYLKGAKREERKTKDGHIFYYNEGGMIFPDALDKPSRTIITSEGGKTPSRFKHVIKDPVNNRLRRLIPLELERLDMFPDNHTIGQNDVKRAFFMGNALVCGIVTKVGEVIYNRVRNFY